MRILRLCLVGFGNVGQAFARLLLKKSGEIEKKYRTRLIVTAISTHRHGQLIDPKGIDLKKALNQAGMVNSFPKSGQDLSPANVCDLIKISGANVMLENTSVNYVSGQPAIDYITTALNNGMHVITANKGPVLHAYRNLKQLAEDHGNKFLFESTVMDGAPIFSLFRKILPVIQLNGFEGILNSCTNLLLERMGNGESLEQAVEFARSIGITETDPAGDIDGWDAAIKVAILVNVLMDYPISLDQISRQGIRTFQTSDITDAKKEGVLWKLVCRAERKNDEVVASVKPQKVSTDSPLFSVQGTSSFVLFKTDTLPGLGILESNPGPETTAYGLLTDLLAVISQD
jgi:homoserine dehydrogenase